MKTFGELYDLMSLRFDEPETAAARQETLVMWHGIIQAVEFLDCFEETDIQTMWKRYADYKDQCESISNEGSGIGLFCVDHEVESVK